MATMPAAESDDARDLDSAVVDPELTDPDEFSNDDEPFKPSVLRTKVIPIFAIVMVVGMLGLLGYSLFAPEDARVGQNWRVGGGGYLIPDGQMTAPDFTAVTFDGQEMQLSDLRGKIVVLNFWASWCAPCRDETPLFEAAHDKLGDDVILLGLNTQDVESEARAFLAEFGVTYQTARDVNGSISLDYGVTGIPETFVIDADGEFAVKYLGEVRTIEQLRTMVAEAR